MSRESYLVYSIVYRQINRLKMQSEKRKTIIQNSKQMQKTLT